MKYNKLYKNMGINFADELDFVYYTTSIVDWLAVHNKNYTKEQYNKIQLLQDILKNLEV